MNKVALSTYKVAIQIGKPKIVQIVWYFVNRIFFKSSLPFPSQLKTFILRLFGAKIGDSVRFKPCINIKYPWKLAIGSNCWIGENVWIDNLEEVEIANDCCLSQGCLLLTGSHNAMLSSFDYTSGPITLESGVWLGANAIVTSGVVCATHAILGAGSVADKPLEAYTIYKGNPAIPTLKRNIR